jgi:hypothetical protein
LAWILVHIQVVYDGHGEFHDVEEEFDEEGNTFFDGGAHVHPEEEPKENSLEED